MIRVAKDAVTKIKQATRIACLHEVFEAQVDKHPAKAALICGDETLTYEALDHQANQLARYLRECNIGPGKLVGIYFDRSEKPIIAILAILKAGAAYVPIDPVHPAERARHILEEAGAAAVLTEEKLAAKASEFFDGLVVPVDQCAAAIAKQSAERLSRKITGVTAEDLCYVLYTSGTTGRPKGVMTEHRNVVQFAEAFNEVIQLDENDRVFQGFSLGFDGSVEEMWMAFSNGATLVVGTSDVVKFGDEVARLFAKKHVTVFSTVPTFLSMITKELPSVRLIIVSGEPCPPDLVKKWADGKRRMLNVYGPTETTVNTTVALCQPDKPVTIGRPLRGYDVQILDEQMQPVEPGQPGELYIGGVGVARGYFNQPELTDKQFVRNPWSDKDADHRLYRTGDLVTQDENGELHFVRRIDHQVKIRGFRIELSEIEAVLREHPQVHQAVVNVFEREGLKELAAYVVAHCASDEFDRDDVLQWLRNRLPPYMVPGYLDVIESMPTLASGKADRKKLPKPETPLVASTRQVVEPKTDLELYVLQVWEKLFKITPISCEDDFFMDLGGYSLLAAQLVSMLRSEHDFEVAIRDVYRFPTVRKLAAHIAESASTQPAAGPATESAPQPSSREVFESVSRWTRWTCIGLQAVSLALFYGVASAPLLAIVLLVLGVINGTVALGTLIYAVIGIVFLSNPVSILLAAATKWLLIGRFKPGEYPLWGWYYFRWWLVTRVQNASGIPRYVGTPIMSLCYRLMGAKVGKNCIIDTPNCAIFDLVTIGDDTAIGSETQLLGYRVEDGKLIIGRVDIGSRCFIGTHCALGVDSRMGDDARLDDMSLLPDGVTMQPGESRRGSPAEPAEVVLPSVPDAVASRRHPFIWGVLHFLASEAVGELLLLTAVPPALVFFDVYSYFGLPWALLAMFLGIPFFVVSFCVIVACIKALIMRRTEPGVHSVESWFYLRKWAVDTLLSDMSGLASMIYTTIYFPAWLRMLGARIGHRAEISTVVIMTPDLMVIEDESFFADGSMVGGRRMFRGHVHVDYNRIGRRSFVGNNALLPIGADLGDNCLLGVLSAPPGSVGSRMPDDTEWLGSPPFQLPHRQKVGGFEPSETYQPTLKLYALRYLIDGMRIVLPIAIAAAASMAFVGAVAAAHVYLPLWTLFALVPLLAMTLVFGCAMSVVVVKNLLMGKFEPVIKPLWSVYVWFNELVNGLYEGLAAPLLAPMLGTPFICSYLRCLGCKIGKHVFLETELFSEFDLVEIGDYAALNLGVVVQNHLFEDRIMKSSHLKIGDECSVGNMSVVLYDSEMKPRSSIGSLSLLMKGETLPERTRWIGIPTNQVREPAHPS